MTGVHENFCLSFILTERHIFLLFLNKSYCLSAYIYVFLPSQYKTLNDFYPEIARCLGKFLDDEKERIEKALK